MNNILTLLIKQPLYAVILILLIIVGNKQCTIEKLQKQAKNNQIEVIYDHELSIVTESDLKLDYILIPEQAVVDSIFFKEAITKEDSMRIYNDILTKYATKNYYSGIARDDSSMYVEWNASVQYNLLDSIQFKLENRYPKYINKYIETHPVRILGGMDITQQYINLNIGLQSKKGNIYEFKYDPINKIYGVGFKTTIIKF